MLRTIAAVVAGYLALAIFVFVTFSLTYLALGPSFAFEPGTVDVTAGWIAAATVLNVLAALLGGWVAARIGRSGAAVKALAVVVLVAGLASAWLTTNAPAKELPERPLTTLEAASYARQPAWYAFLQPLIGLAGVLAGGALGRGHGAAPAPSPTA